MKNFNFKSLIALVTLLTIGVGQMWADNVGYFRHAKVTMTVDGNDRDLIFALSGQEAIGLNSVTTLSLKAYECFCYKMQDGGNICGAGKMYYRIYSGSSSEKAFSSTNRDMMDWNYKEDGQWPSDAPSGVNQCNRQYIEPINVNILDGLEDGVYTLEFYFTTDVCSGNMYLNNGGNNFKITFTKGDVPPSCPNSSHIVDKSGAK